MGKKLKSFAEWRLQENLIEYNFYFRFFKKLLMIMFKWSGLPDGISVRYLEEQCFYNGFVIFFKSKYGYVVTKGAQVGINAYNEPIGFHAISDDGAINEYVKASDCVVIYNNILRYGSVNDVNFFSKKLSNVTKTIDINLDNMKHPFIIQTTETQKQSVLEVLKKRYNGEPYILVDEDFAKHNASNVFNLDIKDYTQSLTDLKNEFISEALTHFGINNVNIHKRERLVTGEVEQNNEEIIISRNSMLTMREKAVEEINKKFDLKISIEYNYDDILNTIKEVINNE